MRLGMVPWPWSGGGGIYQYSHSLLLAVQALGLDRDCLIFSDHVDDAARVYGRFGIEVRPIAPPPKGRAAATLGKVVGEGPHRDLWRRMRENKSRARRPDPLETGAVNWKPHLTSMLHEAKVELMIYAWPSAMPFEARVPYLMAIHDLQHRIQPEFPEVSMRGEWEIREYVVRNAVRHATRILTDSDIGKEDVLDLYGFTGVSEDRVEVLPFAPSPLLHAPTDGEVESVRARYRLPKDYLFYPAQFWPHKNHIRVIEAIHRLRLRGSPTSIVLVGSHADPLMEETWGRVRRLVTTYGLESVVLFLGYVSDDVMSCLYAGAQALLFPTFFGPTNIPVLEAWSFDVPVITSDIRGIREHTGDAAYLVDPRSVDAIADGIERVTGDSKLRKRLTKAGRARVATYRQDDFNQRLKQIIERVEPVVAAEGFRD